MKLSPLGAGAAVQSGTTSAVPSMTATAAGAAPAQVQVGVQAEGVQAAHKAMAALPEVDMARVAEIKEALARGDIAFDPRKLAGLIARHHGGRG